VFFSKRLSNTFSNFKFPLNFNAAEVEAWLHIFFTVLTDKREQGILSVPGIAGYK